MHFPENNIVHIATAVENNEWFLSEKSANRPHDSVWNME
jgi:hypothetical protein